MNKKKLAALLVAGVLTVSVVGGTLAWFTSSDSVTNTFSTSGSIDPNNTDANAGVKIHENFDKKKAENITPGTNVNKEVQVHSTVTYDQFIKVKITPQFTKNGEALTTEQCTSLGVKTDMIQLNYSDNVKTNLADATEGNWYKDADGYFYYIGKLGKGSFTNTLLKSVTLSKTASNAYKGLGFTVKVDADAIQASNDAYKDWAATDVQSKFETLENGSVTPPTDTIITNIPTK